MYVMYVQLKYVACVNFQLFLMFPKHTCDIEVRNAASFPLWMREGVMGAVSPWAVLFEVG